MTHWRGLRGYTRRKWYASAVRRNDGWRRSHRRPVAPVDILWMFLVRVDACFVELDRRNAFAFVCTGPEYQDRCGCRQYGGLRTCFLLLLFVLGVCVSALDQCTDIPVHVRICTGCEDIKCGGSCYVFSSEKSELS